MVEILLNLIPLIIFGYCLYLGFSVAKQLYGGKFTSFLPPFIGSISLFFGIYWFHILLGSSPIYDTTFFVVVTQMLQLVAGLFMLQSLYLLYQISFATTGFLEENK